MSVRAYNYSQFCCRYQAWCQSHSMRQQHLAGEKCFIDYCGSTVPVISPKIDECSRPRSSWLYWEHQTTPSRRPPIRSRCRTGFSATSGCWRSSVVFPIQVPDNLKSEVNKPVATIPNRIPPTSNWRSIIMYINNDCIIG